MVPSFSLCCYLSINFSIIFLRLIKFLFSHVNRKMHTLKAYVRNKAYPEGSIRNYNRDQANQMEYLSVFKPIVRLLGAAIQDELTLSNWAKMRWYVLNNCDEVYWYIIVQLERDGVRDIEKKQEMKFYRWFSKRVSQLQKEELIGVTEYLKILSNSPEKLVTRYMGCVINRIRFHRQDRDCNRRTQNCEVLVKGEHGGKSIDFY
ncbi:hypothetical protein ACOSP7_026792 [Xanthoceras sorbifolium]